MISKIRNAKVKTYTPERTGSWTMFLAWSCFWASTLASSFAFSFHLVRISLLSSTSFSLLSTTIATLQAASESSHTLLQCNIIIVIAAKQHNVLAQQPHRLAHASYGKYDNNISYCCITETALHTLSIDLIKSEDNNQFVKITVTNFGVSWFRDLRILTWRHLHKLLLTTVTNILITIFLSKPSTQHSLTIVVAGKIITSFKFGF